MLKFRRTILPLAMLISSVAFAQQKPILLYPGGVPNSKPAPDTYKEKTEGYSISMVTEPTITPYFPEKDKATGTAIVIFPGGSYINLASDHEGRAIALEFNKIGVTAFVVKYRLPSDQIMVDKTIGPLQDAERAIQMVRERAAEWGVNPHKVGVIGFSAGGHLASTIDTHFDKVVIDNKNNISVRPDFAMLIYPVISFGPFAHAFSRENLIGKNPSQQLIDLYSNEKQVTANTPPTFLIHAEDDDVVPVQNSLLFYDALVKNKVKAEIHLFQAGGHGFGLNNPTTTDHWFDWAANWLRGNGF
ncbi:alpha/beta hydrolase [Mucilaginibacter sp.]|uniref:alpha/beta hydrolase n=1 Tax=Mucilaginibacter sp. TaxID=1882438 RepID=UPI002CA17125|nr:alpha/beta hydrolase [Mucilaginibacter sp.]HTI59753.1 alpha/beta hydrolase [Mucilaginibacter sp.]